MGWSCSVSLESSLQLSVCEDSNIDSVPPRQFLLHDTEPNEAAKPDKRAVQVCSSLQRNSACRGDTGGPSGHPENPGEGGGQLEGDGRPWVDLIGDQCNNFKTDDYVWTC